MSPSETNFVMIEQHKKGLDMSIVSSPLYLFPSHLLLGDLVNVNPARLW